MTGKKTSVGVAESAPVPRGQELLKSGSTSSDGEDAETAADPAVQERGLLEVDVLPRYELYDDRLVVSRAGLWCVVGSRLAEEEERPVGRDDDEFALRLADQPELQRDLQHDLESTAMQQRLSSPSSTDESEGERQTKDDDS